MTTGNDVAMQGSLAFSSTFNNKTISVSGSTGSTTLSVAQMPSHNHALPNWSSSTNLNNSLYYGMTKLVEVFQQAYTTASGSNHGHAHSFSGNAALNMQLKHCSVIICTKA